jgi:hypothetical protein
VLVPVLFPACGRHFGIQAQGFATCLSIAILENSMRSFRLVVSEAFPSPTGMIRKFTDARSNTFLAGLETLAVSCDLNGRDPNDSLRSFATLVDSIPSASLVHFTLLLKQPYRRFVVELNWAPLADAIQRLDREFSPGARKVVRIAILADMLSGPTGNYGVSIADEVVPLVQSATECVRLHADVEVVSGTIVTFNAVSPVPHFPLVCKT